MLGAHQIGLTSGSAPPFVPTDLGSTLKALYEAPNIQHSGSATTGWLDSSGNGFDLATVGSVGYTSNNGGGGHPAAQFSGASNNHLLQVSATNVRVRSFFAVISDLTTTGVACFSGGGRTYLFLGNQNQLALFTFTFAPNSGQTIPTTGRHSIGYVARAANDVDFYLDGVMVNQTTGSSFYSDTAISMGAENSGIQPCPCNCEFAAFMDTALSTTDANSMIAYMLRVYGV